MTQYESAQCPKCGRLLSRYRVDVNGSHRTSVSCPKCKAALIVEYGNGRIKVYTR